MPSWIIYKESVVDWDWDLRDKAFEIGSYATVVHIRWLVVLEFGVMTILVQHVIVVETSTLVGGLYCCWA